MSIQSNPAVAMEDTTENDAVELYRRYGCKCCTQLPIEGTRFHVSNDAINIITTCQTCFLELPDEYKRYVALVVPAPDPLQPTGNPAEQETQTVRKDVWKTLCESVTLSIPPRLNPIHVVRRVFACARGDLSCHYGVRCNGCGVSPVPGWIFECVDCKKFSLCQQCCLHPIQGKEHDKNHAFLATHAKKLRGDVIQDQLLLVIYSGILAVLLCGVVQYLGLS